MGDIPGPDRSTLLLLCIGDSNESIFKVSALWTAPYKDRSLCTFKFISRILFDVVQVTYSLQTYISDVSSVRVFYLNFTATCAPVLLGKDSHICTKIGKILLIYSSFWRI